jgi:ankyrin repeat protein
MDDYFFIPVIQGGDTACLRRVVFQFDHHLPNTPKNERQIRTNNSPCWEFPNGVNDSTRNFRYIYDNIESYLTNNFKDTEPALVYLPPVDKDMYEEQSILGDEAISVMLGILLAAANKIMGWKLKARWCTITATGTFKNIEPIQDEDLLLEEISGLRDDEDKHFQGKITGFKRDIKKIKQGNGKHLFLYVSDDISLEEEDNNFCVKSFSPVNNTLFDILDYVFDDLPFLSDRYIDGERKKFFDDFEKKTEYLRKEKQIEAPFYHDNTYSSILENDSLFIHGPYGSGKSCLAMQLVRRLVWERKIYVPVWINFINERLTEAGLEPITIDLKINNEILPQEIQKELFSIFGDQYNEESLYKKMVEKEKRYLIIIDGLDIPDLLLDQFILRIKEFNADMIKNGNHIIFTSTNGKPCLENLSLIPMPVFDSKAVWFFFNEISKNKEYYNVINKKMNNSYTGDRELSDWLYLQKVLCENYGNFPHLLEIISEELFLSDKDYQDFLFSLETTDKDDLIKKASICYKNRFNNPDPYNMFNDDAKWILLYFINYGSDSVTLKKIQDDIDEIIGKDDPDAGERITKILFGKNGFERRNVLDKLSGNKFILWENDTIKIYDKLTYKTLILDDSFSSDGLRERLVSEKRWLNERIFECFTYIKKGDDPLKQAEGKNEFIERLSEKKIKEKKIKKGCHTLHGIARWCTYIDVFGILFKICPELLYTKEKGKIKPVVDEDGRTVLHYAAGKNQDLDVLNFIVQEAGECGLSDYISCECKSGDNALHYAIKFNLNPEIIYFLLNHKGMTKKVINHRNSEGFTPLHYAVMRGDFGITEQLLKFGADPNIKDNIHNFTPLHSAVEIGRGGKFIDLLATSENINAKTGQEYFIKSTPLLLALDFTYDADKKKIVVKDTVKQLINHHANVEITNDQGNTPLHYAVVTCGDIDILNMLATKKTINSINRQGRTPLAIAIWFGVNREVIEFLLQNGANY